MLDSTEIIFSPSLHDVVLVFLPLLPPNPEPSGYEECPWNWLVSRSNLAWFSCAFFGLKRRNMLISVCKLSGEKCVMSLKIVHSFLKLPNPCTSIPLSKLHRLSTHLFGCFSGCLYSRLTLFCDLFLQKWCIKWYIGIAWVNTRFSLSPLNVALWKRKRTYFEINLNELSLRNAGNIAWLNDFAGRLVEKSF